jgi:hypothetical protein
LTEEKKLPLVTKVTLADSKELKKKSTMAQKKIVEKLERYKHNTRAARARLNYELHNITEREEEITEGEGEIKEDSQKPGQIKRDDGNLEDKLDWVLNDIGKTLPHATPASFFERDPIDSTKEYILGMVKGVDDAKMLVDFDERLNVLGHLVRVTREIIDRHKRQLLKNPETSQAAKPEITQ